MLQKYYLAYLLSVPEIGRKTVLKIIHYVQQVNISLEELIREKLLRLDILNTKQKKQFELFQKKYTLTHFVELLHALSIRVVTHEDKEFPNYLHYIEDKPLLLFVKGNEFNNTKIPIAMVGSRKITPYGKQATEFLVSDFESYNTTIISGFMYGVDMTAHQAALRHSIPTVGVLGFGLNMSYPKSFKNMFLEMLAQGVTLLSEYGPYTPAMPGNFPVRNRIVAGIAQATVVVEAAVESGSLITAQCALDYNRMVGAVPGPFNSLYSEGTKSLINQGAKIVTSAHDVMEELFDPLLLVKPTKNLKNKQRHFSSKIEKDIYDALMTSKDFDELQHCLDLPTIELSKQLTTMELTNLIKRNGSLIERV